MYIWTPMTHLAEDPGMVDRYEEETAHNVLWGDRVSQIVLVDWLPGDLGDDDLVDLLGAYGGVVDVMRLTHHAGQRTVALVLMESTEGALAASRSLNTTKLEEGGRLHVRQLRPAEHKYFVSAAIWEHRMYDPTDATVIAGLTKAPAPGAATGKAETSAPGGGRAASAPRAPAGPTPPTGPAAPPPPPRPASGYEDYGYSAPARRVTFPDQGDYAPADGEGEEVVETLPRRYQYAPPTGRSATPEPRPLRMQASAGRPLAGKAGYQQRQQQAPPPPPGTEQYEQTWTDEEWDEWMRSQPGAQSDDQWGQRSGGAANQWQSKGPSKWG